MEHRIRLIGILCFLVMYTFASFLLQATPVNSEIQTSFAKNAEVDSTNADRLNQPKTKKIQIKSSEWTGKREGFEPYVLLDSVILAHDGAIMNCDSAYLDENKNTFEAFSDIVVNQGDTLLIYGNYLHYDGNTKLLKMRGNVRLENRDMTLFTDSLDYDREANIGYYFDGGTLVDSVNQLTSFWGQYEPDKRMTTFNDSVKLLNPNFTLFSDTLKYNTFTKVATILGPSTIVSDSATIYSKRGWYDTQSGQSMLLDRSLVVTKNGNRTLTGDSVSYHRNEHYTEIFGNMVLQDTLKKIILKGNYGYYNETTKYAMATKRASCIEYSQLKEGTKIPDSLYLHGDSLEIFTKKLEAIPNILDPKLKLKKNENDSLLDIKDSLHIQLDSLNTSLDSLKTDVIHRSHAPKSKKDSLYRIIKAYHNVRFYRSNLQGVCDSMKFSTNDSMLYMYRQPVIWNDSQQLSGDTITMFMNDSNSVAHIINSCFAIQQIDSIHYNQLKGKDLKAFFDGNDVRYILLQGNAQTLFYPEDKGQAVTKMHHAESSYFSMTLHKRKIQRVKYWPKSSGQITPIGEVKTEDLKLPDFYWFDYLRPLNKDDIFRKVQKKVGTETKKPSEKFKQVYDE